MSEFLEGGPDDRFLTFQVGLDRFVVAAACVREILRVPELTRVPGSPSALAGLANLRGSVLPVVDVAKALHRDARSSNASTRVIVVEAGSVVGLMVDRVAQLSSGQHLIEDEDSTEDGFGSVRLHGSRGNARLIDVARLLADAFPHAERRATCVETVRRSFSAAPKAADDARHALVSFDVAGRTYALPLADVEEVMNLPKDVVAVPMADASVIGMVSLRNRLLPLLSLSVLLGLGSTQGFAAGQRVIVARAGSVTVGLVVEAMGSILRPLPSMLDPVPRVLKREGRTAIDAICRLDGGRNLVSVLAVERLFDEETVRRAVGERDGNGTGGDQTARGATMQEQFVVFELGSASYGLPIGAVSEIVRVPETVTRLPRAPSFVEGVINLRGTVVPVIDQRRRFDLVPGVRNASQRILVLETAGGKTGILVDAVSRILRLPADAVRPAPDLAHHHAAAVTRVATLTDGRLLLIADPTALFDLTERAMIEDLADTVASSAA